MRDRDFFATRNPQAVLKHGLLGRYAHYFAGRAGFATGGKVAFIDGYSGAGRYEDGSPGSPLLLASSAARAETMRRDVRLAFVEPDASVRSRLMATLQREGITPDIMVEGGLEDVLHQLLDRYQDRAVLLFVDPFGLGLSYAALIGALQRSSSRSPIDVLFHFSILSVARMGRAAALGKGARTNAALLDRALGPVDWRSAFADAHDGDGKATRVASELAGEFGRAVAAECGVQSLSIPVRKRPHHLPAFALTLFTRDPVGKALWDFADMAGSAHVDWLLRCESDDYEAYVSEQKHQLTLFQVREQPTEAAVEALVAGRTASYLPKHLAELIRERGTLVPQDDPAAVFGGLLGAARERHVRSALAQLVADGTLAGKTSGQFRNQPFKAAVSDGP
jgi:three-Cys-motif partner protein